MDRCFALKFEKVKYSTFNFYHKDHIKGRLLHCTKYQAEVESTLFFCIYLRTKLNFTKNKKLKWRKEQNFEKDKRSPKTPKSPTENLFAERRVANGGLSSHFSELVVNLRLPCFHHCRITSTLSSLCSSPPWGTALRHWRWWRRRRWLRMVFQRNSNPGDQDLNQLIIGRQNRESDGSKVTNWHTSLWFCGLH